MMSRRDFVVLLHEATNEAEEARIIKKMENKMKMKMKEPDQNENADLKKKLIIPDKLIIPKSVGYGMLTCPIEELDEIETDSEIEEVRKKIQLKCHEFKEEFKRDHPEEFKKMERKQRKRNERKERKRKERKEKEKKNKKMKLKVKAEEEDEEEENKKLKESDNDNRD